MLICQQCWDYHDDSTFGCPLSIPLEHLASVRLSCELRHASTLIAESSSKSADFQTNIPSCADLIGHFTSCGCRKAQHGNLDGSEDGLRKSQRTCLVNSTQTLGRHLFTETAKEDPYSLNKETLVRLIDDGLRRCICPDAVNLNPGIGAVRECQKLPLSEFAPNIFNRGYNRNFEQQAVFVAGIARILASFLSASRPNPATSGNVTRKDSADEYDYGCQVRTRERLLKNLWTALAKGIRGDKSARRLSSLWFARGPPGGEPLGRQTSMDSSKVMQNIEIQDDWESSVRDQQGMFDGEIPPAGEDSSLSENRGTGELLNQSPISSITSVWNHGIENATAPRYHDANFGSEGPGEVDINRFFHATDTSMRRIDEKRSRTNSSPQGSDVSMLTALVRKAPHISQEAHAIKSPDVIRNRSSLTQNVIRMHPLRKHERGEYGTHSNGCEERGAGLYESTVLQWVDNLSDEELFAPNEPFDCCSSEDTRTELNSSATITDDGLISIFQDTIYDSTEEDNILDFPMPLSTTESEHLSNSSLSDVIGNDHLLWHMWKRRASVAPRGEQDVEDMRMLYESDPDMKLFGKGWGLDASNMSSSSNQDPMLQEMPSRSRKTGSPASPMSERRSYFGPTRSSSSSSSSGQETPDPKLQRRGSIMKRFSWGGRQHAAELTGLEMANLNGRDFEVKRRRTMDDYATMEKETHGDDSNEMLF